MQFGRFEIVRYLTSGGMADLYLARLPSLDKDLVLKRIQSRYVDLTRVIKLFVDEGRIARTLDHPNIVRLVDVGNLDGSYYIAMEYIPGHDLIAIARRSMETRMFVPRGVAVGIVSQVATGLAYAHTRRDDSENPLNIVHCDISPGNIVVSWRGTAKIVDFGIARATIQLRKEDGIVGKYNYMAPEQIRGEPVDARADLFSLGVILYELTLGRRLFKGRGESVRGQVLAGSIPRPRAVVPDYPEALERILGRLLMADRERRYPSAAELRAELHAYLQERESGWSKLDIARYLRELFRAPLRDATGEAVAEIAAGAEDEELELEHAMPSINDEIDADADDLEQESLAFTSAFEERVIATAAAHGRVDETPPPRPVTIAEPAAPPGPPAEAQASLSPDDTSGDQAIARRPVRRWLVAVGVALAALLALLWLARSRSEW